MLNQAAMETLYSATYLDDYLDCVENLPDDIQRQLSKMMEIDVNYQSLMRELETHMSCLLDDKNDDAEASNDEKAKKKIYSRIQQILIKTQELGDEKLQIGQQVQDLVDNKARQLDLDKKNMDFKKEQDSFDTPRETKSSETTERTIKRARRARHEVFVPSILGPSTLEATSFSETPNESQHTSHQSSNRVSFSHHSSSSSSNAGLSSSAGSSSTSGNLTGSGNSHSAISSASGSSSNTISTREGSSSSGAEKGSGSGGSSSNANNSRDSGVYSSATTPKKSQKQTQEKKQNKKRKSTKQSDSSPQNIPIDPDEPLYCLCDQVSYGEMIGCDNDLCPIEWFHFSCVSLTIKPKGKWYCPKCRGDRPNIMKPKAIFLKELEKYNREKEEKA